MDWLKKLLQESEVAQETIDKVMESAEQIKMIPKERFDEVNNANKELKKQLADRDKQLEELGKSSKDNEELVAKINELQDENKRTQAEYEERITNMKIDEAINSKFADSKYSDLLMGKIDRTKLAIGEDGKISGLDEQYDAIKEQYADLFSNKSIIKGVEPRRDGGKTTVISKEEFAKMNYRERLELYNNDKALYDVLSKE